MNENAGHSQVDAVELELYRWRDPSPPKVGQALGISGQHVKNLCRELNLPMLNVSLSVRRPSWRIPRRSFRALREHIEAARHESTQ